MKKRKSLFIYFLFIVMLCAYPMVGGKMVKKYFNPSSPQKPSEIIYNNENMKENESEQTSENNKDETVDIKENTEIKDEPDKENLAGETEQPVENNIQINPEFTKVDMSYFSDALFVGDSRTDELKDYGNIEGADFFCETALNVFKLLKKEIDVKGVGKTSLENLLQKKSYGKIYLMLGINEIGYNFNDVMKNYQEIVDTIRKYQPDSILFICANLHVAKKRALQNPEFSKKNMDELNERMKEVALKEKKGFYIDVNEIFDDEEGYLNAEYTGDNVHLYAKKYKLWVDWLMTKGIVYNE